MSGALRVYVQRWKLEHAYIVAVPDIFHGSQKLYRIARMLAISVLTEHLSFLDTSVLFFFLLPGLTGGVGIPTLVRFSFYVCCADFCDQNYVPPKMSEPKSQAFENRFELVQHE